MFQERQVSNFSGTNFSPAVSPGTSRQASKTLGHALFQEMQVSNFSGPRLTPVLTPGPDMQCREVTPLVTTHDQVEPSSMSERTAEFGRQVSNFSGPRIPPALPRAQSVVQIA